MNENFDNMFEQIKQQCAEGTRLLLHVCCAPCATYCLTRVLDRFDVTLFYSNDNITDCAEWEKRLQEVKKLVEIVNSGKFVVKPAFPLKLVIQSFDSKRFFDAAQGLEGEKEGGARCEKCFAMRLQDTQRYAEANGFAYFGTTLTVSPFKNSRTINRVGMSLQTENPDQRTQWLPANFKKRDGYNQSIVLSQQYGLYRQHYCGCEFSKEKSD